MMTKWRGKGCLAHPMSPLLAPWRQVAQAQSPWMAQRHPETGAPPCPLGVL